MSIPDPFAPFAGSPLHRMDIESAEAVTGVHGRSWSRHAVQPAVQAGVRPKDAVAVLHWASLGLAGAAGLWWLSRR